MPRSDPTAMHAVADGHDTPFSGASMPLPELTSGGAGMLWTVHRDPFQPSANGTVPLVSDPTAMQIRTEGHDTPLRSLAARLGARWIDHRKPFQRSTNAP